jgi:hypothetical protein
MYLRCYLETGDYARVIDKRRELQVSSKTLCRICFHDLTTKKHIFMAMEVEKTTAEALLMNILPLQNVYWMISIVPLKVTG